MHGIVAKLARLAASKAAAFTYAVAVGVAGNIAFNFVQQHHPAPPPSAAAPSELRPAAVRPEATAPLPARRATRPAEPVPVALPPEKPPTPARHPAAAIRDLPALPELPAVLTLPDTDSLPAPALKAAILPAGEPARPEPKQQASAPPEPAESMHNPASETAVLQPLGKPLDVAAPPLPPVAAAPPASDDAAGPAAPAAGVPRSADSGLPDGSPHRAGISATGPHRTGDRLPAIGDDAPPHRPTASAQPIPLIPEGTDSAKPDRVGAAPAASGHPGPGSGGLY